MVTVEQKYEAAMRIMNFMVDLLPEEVLEVNAAGLAFKLDQYEKTHPSTKAAHTAVIDEQVAAATVALV